MLFKIYLVKYAFILRQLAVIAFIFNDHSIITIFVLIDNQFI